jgi:hypothetical protein
VEAAGRWGVAVCICQGAGCGATVGRCWLPRGCCRADATAVM